ncbi:SOS response-associated peptidase family protein [Pseudomonas helleri]|uniref:SOS response-associated peptidase family protein n=1 Tax=Pseudomonas helleri TaxID=1608996 RepID=UPI003FD007C1
MAYTILGPLQTGGVKLPFYAFKVPAGFPSPAADHIEKHISLDELFELRAPHIYLVKIDGDPTRIERSDGEIMGIAGIWERWKSPSGEWVLSYSMLTVNADQLERLSQARP